VGLVVEDSRNYPGGAVVRMFVTFVFISIVILNVVKNPSGFVVTRTRSFATLRMTVYFLVTRTRFFALLGKTAYFLVLARGPSLRSG
jgi:hypothetical protein